MIASQIPCLIDAINRFPNASYITTSALDEKKHGKIVYNENKVFEKGIQALKANNNLYVHPSGSAYKREMMDLKSIDQFIKKEVRSKFGFIVHNLMRIELSQKGVCNFERFRLDLYNNDKGKRYSCQFSEK